MCIYLNALKGSGQFRLGDFYRNFHNSVYQKVTFFIFTILCDTQTGFHKLIKLLLHFGDYCEHALYFISLPSHTVHVCPIKTSN